ncbi:unnamed protein product [Oikopleura dioica]|uniref:Uncharacterized protein n=1 Tax=Oikopleura dioica TaxID=34765 RepID=E4XMF2_OIKDI|nr:unnamed protein product [Oikopleura dioica]
MVMLLANYFSLKVSLEETALTPTESFCYQEYKKCLMEKNIVYEHCWQEMYSCREVGEFRHSLFILTKETVQPAEKELNFTEYENLVNKRLCFANRFADRKFCQDLCNQSLEQKVECEALCTALISDGNICPGQENCPFGCPCPEFRCKNYTKRKQLFWKEFVVSEDEVIENPASLCLAYQESLNDRICEMVVYPEMLKTNLTANDFVLEGDFIGLNYEVCNVVFQGQNHVITSFGALAQLAEKYGGTGINYVVKVKPMYDYWKNGFSFESYSTCGVGFEDQDRIIICSPSDDLFGCYFYSAGNRFSRFRQDIPYISASRSNMIYFKGEVHIFTQSVVDSTLSTINTLSSSLTWRRWSFYLNRRRNGAWAQYATGIFPVADDKGINVFVQSFFEDGRRSQYVYRLTELFRLIHGTWVKLAEHRRDANSIFSLTGIGANWASDLMNTIKTGGKAWQVDGEFYFEDYSEYFCVTADNFTDEIQTGVFDGHIRAWKCQVGYKARLYKLEMRHNRVSSWMKFPSEETTLNRVPAGWFSIENRKTYLIL